MRTPSSNARLALADFDLVCRNAWLAKPDSGLSTFAFAAAGAGIYVWTFIEDPSMAERVLYVGRTTSLKRRVADHKRGFQPHSPNDFKLQVAQAFIREQCKNPDASLYFRAIPLPDLRSAESQAIDDLSPLINPHRNPDPTAVQDFREAFTTYYSKFLEGAWSARSDA